MNHQNPMRFDDVPTETNESDESVESVNAEETAYLAEVKPSMNRQAIGFLGILLSAGAVIALMTLRGGPQTASAANATAESTKANTAITSFLSGGNTNLATMQKMLKDTEKVVAQFLAYPSTTQVPLGNLKTNPFKLITTKQSITDAEVLKNRREQERVSALKSVQNLKLQSILYAGNSRSCMVNNSMVKEGEVIESFTIERISAQSVIVRSGAYRFELKMTK